MSIYSFRAAVFALTFGLVTTARAGDPPAGVTFLDAEQAKAALVDDPEYFDQLQPMEMQAKTGLTPAGGSLDEQRATCRRSYQAGVRTFSTNEQEALTWYVGRLQPVLSRDYPLFGQLPWSFLKVSDRIEGGLPHTRGAHIVLSQIMCRQIVAVREMPADSSIHVLIQELLVHEQMHVFQRKYAGRLDSLYKDIWGFARATSIDGCPWLTEHHLANPDAPQCKWILPVKSGAETRYLWPLVAFSDGDGPKTMPGDFTMLSILLNKTGEGYAVQVDTNGLPVFTDLRTTPEFTAVFPASDNIYHPDEAAADVFAKLVMAESFKPSGDVIPARMEKQFAPCRKWFRDHLK